MRLSQQRILFQTKSIERKRKLSVFINYLPKVKQTLLNHPWHEVEGLFSNVNSIIAQVLDSYPFVNSTNKESILHTLLQLW